MTDSLVIFILAPGLEVIVGCCYSSALDFNKTSLLAIVARQGNEIEPTKRTECLPRSSLGEREQSDALSGKIL